MSPGIYRHVVSWKPTDVSQEEIATIITVELWSKQEINMRQKLSCCLLHVDLPLDLFLIVIYIVTYMIGNRIY
jgi:hypothetical protein